MKIALDPYMHRHVPLLELPDRSPSSDTNTSSCRRAPISLIGGSAPGFIPNDFRHSRNRCAIMA